MASVNLAELFKQEDSSIQRIRCDTVAHALRVMSADGTACMGPASRPGTEPDFHDVLAPRADNLFKQLDERQLTDEEERIIQQRVRDKCPQDWPCQ